MEKYEKYENGVESYEIYEGNDKYLVIRKDGKEVKFKVVDIPILEFEDEEE